MTIRIFRHLETVEYPSGNCVSMDPGTGNLAIWEWYRPKLGTQNHRFQYQNDLLRVPPRNTYSVYIYIWFLLLFASLPPRMISPSVWVIFDPYPCMGTMSCVVSSWFLGYQKPSVLLDAFDAQSDYVSACLSHLLAKIPMLISPINGLYNSNSMPMNDYRYPIVYSKYDIYIYISYETYHNSHNTFPIHRILIYIEYM